MRLLNWLAPVLSIVLISHAYSTVHGQGYPPAMPQNGMIQPVSYNSANLPGFFQNVQSSMGAPPPPPNFFQAATGGYGAPGMPGIPMNAGPQAPLNAFPQMTPFEKMFQQHRVDKNGLWSYRSSNAGKKYFFSMEALFARYQNPGGALIGNVGSISYLGLVEDELIDATDDEIFDQFSENEGLNYFNAAHYNKVPKLNAPGSRLRWGWTNDDQSGFEFTGWWIARADSSWSAIEDSTHKPDPANQEIMSILLSPPNFIDPTGTGVVSSIPGVTTAEINTVLQNELMNLAGLPLDDGSINGVTVPYDLDFRVKVVSQAWGTNATWMSTPFVDKKALKVRTLAGARYMQVREGFGFVGVDSGLLYSDANNIAGIRPDLKLFSLPTGTDENEDGIVDNAGAVEDDGAGTGTSTAFFVAPVDPVTGLAVTPTTTYVNSKVDTNLAGPELGIQFDIGGDKFKIWGQTKVGIMANQETIELEGDNVGMIIRADPDDIDRPKALIDPTVDDPNPNAFTDRQTHTHISPLFEQSIFMEMSLFDKLPVLKRMKLLEEAKFKVGYTYIVAGEIARPFDSIRWQGMPTRGLFPSINVKREAWSVGTWSVGIDWLY